MKNILVSRWLVLSGLLLSTSPALALSTFSPTSLNSLTGPLVDSLVKTVALGADHRAYQSAAPLGSVIGLDIGIDATLINIPDEFIQAMQVTGSGTPPSMIPIPRLNIRKGLPFKADVGFSYIGYQGYTLMGFDAQWSPITLMGFNTAVRGSYNMSKLFYLDTHTIKLDALISKNLIVIEPYLGLGFQNFGGNVVVPTGQALAPTVSGSSSGSTGHFFVGLPLKLAIIHVTAEYDMSFASISTYGLKTSLNF